MSGRNESTNRLSGRIAALDWVLLVLIVPLVLFPSPARLPVLLLIPVTWLARRIDLGHFVISTPVDWPLFGLLFMVLVSMVATPDLEASMPKIVGMVFGIAVFYAAVAQVRDSPRRLWLGVGLLLACGWAIIAVGLAAARWTAKLPLLQEIVARLPQPSVALPGAIEGVINPNEIAGVLLWITPLALALAWQVAREWPDLKRRLPAGQMALVAVFIIGSALLLTVALLLAQSRGGLLGFIAALLLMFLVKIKMDWRWLLGILTLFLLLAVGIVTIVGGEMLSGLLFNPTSAELTGNAVDTLQGRLEIWSRALFAVQDFPLTGLGMNTFRRVVHILYPPFLIPPNVDIAHAHNHLLQTALDLGVPGLIAYLALWLGAAGMLWRAWRASADPWQRTLALGFAASLFGYFVYGMSDAVALGARPGFIFWLLLGLVAGLHQQVTAPRPPPGAGRAGNDF